MTIKSEEKDVRWCERTKNWFSIHSEDLGVLARVGLLLLLVGVIVNGIVSYFMTDYGEALAKDLVRKDYPTVMCLSGNGQFRLYESKTYTIHRHKENGWNIYWTKQGDTDSSAFHLGKCEIK